MPDSKNFIWQFVYDLLSSLYEYLVKAMIFLVQTLMTFPLLANQPEIKEIWQWMLLLSCMFIPIIFLWLCLKKLAGGQNWDTNLKQTFVRIFYMFGFTLLTFPFIDWLIRFNNTLISALVTRYNIQQNLTFAVNNTPQSSDLVAGAVIIVQLYFVGKIVVGYFLRVLEVNFAVIISPALYVLWINQGWSGYIGQWISRMVALIFSQFIQVLILVLYSQMFHKFVNNGSWDHLFLALAALIMMDKVPNVVQNFVARDNAADMAWRSLTNGTRRGYRTYQFARDPKGTAKNAALSWWKRIIR